MNSYKIGPLANYIDRFASALRERGYSHQTAKHHLRVISGLSRWLLKKDISIYDVRLETLERYLFIRKKKFSENNSGNAKALLIFSEMMFQLGFCNFQKKIVSSPVKHEIQQYVEYLENQKGLLKTTQKTYSEIIERFLFFAFPNEKLNFKKLSRQTVLGYISKQAKKYSLSRISLTASSLRSFLEYLFLNKRIETNLKTCVPQTARWELAKTPKFISMKDVQLLLNSCDRATPLGKRNYAILLLMAKAGLRACEIIRMQLDDIDWENGTIVIRGKGGQFSSIVISQDIGNALFDYIKEARPSQKKCLEVFLSSVPPFKGFTGRTSVTNIVISAFSQTGIDCPRQGSHLLRHSLATHMINNGSSMDEVREILRHNDLQSTAIYAKVDFKRLRTITLPWPK